MLAAERGCSVLSNFSKASWWKWTGGSSLLFWRWGNSFQTAALKGFRPWILGPLPCYKRKAKSPKKELFPLYLSKCKDIVNKGYILAPIPKRRRVEGRVFERPMGEGRSLRKQQKRVS